MRIQLPYGNEILTAGLDCTHVDVLDIRDIPPIQSVADTLRAGLADPIGMDHPFLVSFNPTESVCIVVPDAFRTAAVDKVLPTLIDALNARGIPDSAIDFLFATGVHRAPTPAEQRTILGPAVAERFRDHLHNHDAYDDANMVTLDTTSRGTEVRVNRLVCESDHVIVTGGVVLHYFGGFGGGRKALVPGVAAAGTIAHNHALNLHPTGDTLDPAVRIGVMDGNPVAEDMLEAARFIGAAGVINTVLNRNAEIAGLFVGDLEQAHAAACEFARATFAVELDAPAHLVLAASPHTRNFVQTHKALYNAHAACAENGRVVLAAPCPEGLGGETFTKWLDLGDPAAVIRGLRRQSEINGQTALSTLAKSPRTIFVTGLSEQDVRKLGGRKAPSLDGAIRLALQDLTPEGESLRVALMPSAAYTVPMLLNPAAL